MKSKQPHEPLPKTLASYDPNVPGVRPNGPPPPLPPPPLSKEAKVFGVNPDRPFPPPPVKEERTMVEEITIAETSNGFIVTVPNSFSGRDIITFEQRESDGCMVKALVSALCSVIENLGYQGIKHDTCRIKVSCQNEENEDA